MNQTKNQPDRISTETDHLHEQRADRFHERTEIEVYSQIQEEGLWGQFARTKNDEEDDDADEPCDECGQVKSLHRRKPTGSFFHHGGVKRPIFVIVCPEPIPVDDAEGRDEA